MTESPVVTVILTHHLDSNREYLKETISSILETEGVPLEVILLADSKTCPDVPSQVTVVHDPALNTATKKAHHGVNLAHPDSQFFLFLSDDVTVSKYMLKPMVEIATTHTMIVNPLSNGEQGTRFLYPEMNLPVTANLGDVQYLEILNYKPKFRSLIVAQDWVPFYCTLIRRDIWKEVGLLDERLETRHNDQDFCYRAKAKRIPCTIHFGAFAFHYGSKTLSQTVLPGEQEEATRVFMEKMEAYHSGGF